MAYTIILDAGHGGDDPGAVYNGRQEKNDNLNLALAVGNILSSNGIDVIFTRTDDIYQTPFQKAMLANENGGNFFISFHRNSSPLPNQYTGVETLVYDKTGIKYEMAENINRALEDIGFKNLGVKSRPGLVVLRRTNMPALLIETGFINTADDNELYDSKSSEIAQAIAYGILKTLDLNNNISSKPHENIPQIPSNPPVPTQPSPSPIPMSPSLPPSSNQPIPPNRPTSPSNPTNGTMRPNRPPMVPNEPDNSELLYRVQVGAFKNRENADRLLYELEEKGYPVFILFQDNLYKVQVGAFRNLGNAIRMEQMLRQNGYTTWITT